MIKTAVISNCLAYRYELTRSWDEGHGEICFVLLNPSTADAELDDPTLRRGIAFAKRFGYKKLTFVNLFAFRATSPKVMKGAADPIGPNNDNHLLQAAERADLIVLAWGAQGGHQERDRAVIELLKTGYNSKLYHFGLTKGGHPKHPLYLKADSPLEKWTS